MATVELKMIEWRSMNVWGELHMLEEINVDHWSCSHPGYYKPAID